MIEVRYINAVFPSRRDKIMDELYTLFSYCVRLHQSGVLTIRQYYFTRLLPMKASLLQQQIQSCMYAYQEQQFLTSDHLYRD